MSIINLSFIKRFFKKPVESTGDELIVTITDERGEVRSVDAKEPLGKAVNLPPSLIMQSGEYCFFDQPFTCSEPGLYRFVKPQVCNAQHIVLDQGNPLNNIIYFSLMAIRGNADNYKSFEQLKKQSTKRLLSLTCGPLSTFVHNLADLQNMRTRIVFTHTLQRANSYNNGHALLEAWIPKLSKYIAVDVDKKCVFRKDTELLDVFELCQSIHAGDSLQIETFADLTYLDLVNFIEPSTGFNYQFLELGIYGAKKGLDNLFGRICNLPNFKLPEGNHFCAWDNESHSIIANRFPDAVILSPTDFKDKFYGS